MKLRYYILAALIVGILLYWLNESDKAAMIECQKKHSFYTCFYSLHH